MPEPTVPKGVDMPSSATTRPRAGHRAGYIALLCCCIGAACVIWGVYSRGAAQRIKTAQDDANRTVKPAVPSDSIKDLPDGNIAALPTPTRNEAISRPLSKSLDSNDLDQNSIAKTSIQAPIPSSMARARPRLIEVPPAEQQQLLAAVPNMTADQAERRMNTAASYAEPSADDRLHAAMRASMSTAQTPVAAVAPAVGLPMVPSPPMQPQPSVQQSGTSVTSVTAKLAFLNQAQQAKTLSDNYLHQVRQAEVCPYSIKAGKDIPAVLVSAIDSDLPGQINAMISLPVMDERQRAILLPQGSRLVGKYDSSVEYGQSRVQVVWDRIIFEDASSITLEGMVGHDQEGKSGLGGKIDRHYKRMFGMAALTSLFTLPFELAQSRQNDNRNGYGYPTVGETAAASVSRELAMTGTMITRKNLNVPPTIKPPIGSRLNVRIGRDICFMEPYTPYANGTEAPAVRKISTAK